MSPALLISMSMVGLTVLRVDSDEPIEAGRRAVFFLAGSLASVATNPTNSSHRLALDERPRLGSMEIAGFTGNT